ncbi:tetratricopeptide repeat protein [Mumia zhuanghuii]|uniref:Tetratricopeptide repeat protein n=1 Tax=Mumia zhuanghuii TaxID=2585211 RepID=A0A5C4MCE0_9ACTN|nr:tetratricopeptide repeat protein [Mumia zhuanghuii]TNC33695.1 tetratricopeptide repeat protein [Mumia zhuanghuii]TNC33927.1 tetratricopeptide repeat protein [Mumia zhuanghuii]
MSFSRPGAVDLSALKKPAAPAGAPAGSAPAGASWVIEVGEQNFQQVLQASVDYVVVVSLWSSRSPQSSTFNQVLADAVNAYAGRMLLAQIDVDTSPQIAQMLGAQGVPFVLGVVKGQPVPLFQGTAEEPQVRQYFDELLRVAEANGVTGTAPPVSAAAPTDEEPADDPRFAAADEAYGEGDYAKAVAEYEKLVAANPADTEAAERLAGARLLQRTDGADLAAARDAAAQNPDDIDAQMLVADLDLSGGHVEDAFGRLIDVVRRTAGDDRERVRVRLVEYFTIVGPDDPRVSQARRSLATALY